MENGDDMTDQEISEALQALLADSQASNTGASFTSLNSVLEYLEVKLGQSLSHRAEFVRSQIQDLLFEQPQTLSHSLLPTTLSPDKGHLTIQQSSIFPATTSSSLASSSISFTSSPANDPQTQSGNGEGNVKGKRRGGPGGLNKLCGVSPELQPIVGQSVLPRTEIVKQLWAYIRRNNLQDPNNRRKIICNDELRVVFETDCTDMFKMNKLLAKHIIPLEPSKQPVKKQRMNGDKVTVQGIPCPSVRISEALANLFGVNVREMLQSEAFTRLWEYIRINELEDPMNPMVICCDEKLEELFGCQSLPASRMPEILGRHHICRIS